MAKKQGKGDEIIKFDAEMVALKTVVDGAIRVTFDLSENDTEVARKLMECRRLNLLLKVAIIPVKINRTDV